MTKNKNYEDYNDFELLYLICEQNEDAYNILYNKYKPIVEMKAKKYYKNAIKKGLDYNDLVQEGMIGLSEAIRDFKIKKDVKFSTFANICIERQIMGAILSANRKKHKILNESLSLEEPLGDRQQTLEAFLSDKSNNDPSNYLIEIENKNETYNKIQKILTPFERQVFDLKLKNFDYKEIAHILGKTYKSIDSALQRIKRKLSKIIEIKKT